MTDAYETTAVSAQVLYTLCNHAPCHFMQSHMCKVYACLSVTCHLHFWQNDQDLLRATVVTRGWNVYRNKSQHRKLTLEKKISHCSCRDSNPWPFNHKSTLTTELSPPHVILITTAPKWPQNSVVPDTETRLLLERVHFLLQLYGCCS